MTSSDKNIYFLAAAHCINKVFDIFSGIFLVSFIFTKTRENVADIGIFHLFSYLIVALMAYLTGNWVKRGNRLRMYQLGVVLTFLSLLGFISLQNQIINYIPLCGALCGLIVSLKAFPFNLIVADNIPDSKMIGFKGYLESLKNIIRITAPLLLGFFLTNASYFKTIAFLAFLALVELILFSQIKSPINKELPPCKIKDFWQKTRQSGVLKKLYQIEFCRGMTIDGTLSTLITLYVIYLFKTDFNLGLITAVFCGITAILNFLFGRCGKYRHFVRILLLTASLVIFSLAVFIFAPGQASFIFYNFAYVVAMQFLRLIADINMFNISNLPEIQACKNEYFVVRELFLTFGRLASYSILIFVGIIGDFGLLKYFLVFLTLFLVLMSINCIKLNRSFSQHDGTEDEKPLKTLKPVQPRNI